MYCLKCGKACGEEQVFCDACLKSMEEEPIDINTPILLPIHADRHTQKHRRAVVNYEEECKRLQKFNQNLILVLVLLVTLVILMAVLVYEKEFWNMMGNLGQNYSVVEGWAQAIGK